MAYQELYLTIARLVYLFDITPEKPEELKKNFQMLDHFSKCQVVSCSACYIWIQL